jgi:hypothetical protein
MKTNVFKNSVSIFVMAIMAISMSSCEPDKLMTFEDGRADVYFEYPSVTTGAGATSAGYRPFLESKFDLVVEDTIWQFIPIRVMGALANYDRPVNFNIVDSLTDAIEGIHYTSIRAFIPANRPNGVLIITTIRPPLTHARPVRLWIELTPNQHFGTTFDSIVFNVSRGEQRSVLNYHIFISDVLTMPVMWGEPNGQLNLGYYSDSKYRLMIRLTGLPPAFWERQLEVDGRGLTPAMTVAAGLMLRFYLYERWTAEINQEVDENGEPIRRVWDDCIDDYMTVPGLREMVFGQ